MLIELLLLTELLLGLGTLVSASMRIATASSTATTLVGVGRRSLECIDFTFAVEASSLAVNVDLIFDEVQELVKTMIVEAFHQLAF